MFATPHDKITHYLPASSVTLAVPFDERTTLTISGGRFVRNANISNYEFVNNSFLMGVSWRF